MLAGPRSSAAYRCRWIDFPRNTGRACLTLAVLFARRSPTSRECPDWRLPWRFWQNLEMDGGLQQGPGGHPRVGRFGSSSSLLTATPDAGVLVKLQ